MGSTTAEAPPKAVAAVADEWSSSAGFGTSSTREAGAVDEVDGGTFGFITLDGGASWTLGTPWMSRDEDAIVVATLVNGASGSAIVFSGSQRD